MNCIKKILVSFILFFGFESINFAVTQSTSQHQTVTRPYGQVRAKVKAKVQQHQQAHATTAQSHTTTAPRRTTIASTKSSKKVASHQINQELIKKFIDSVDAIHKRPTATKFDEKDTTSNKDYEEKKKSYYEKIENAYASYKALYEESKKSGATIIQSDNDEIKKAARKLFERKNIQNMVWHGNVDKGSKVEEKTAGIGAAPTSVPKELSAQITPPAAPSTKAA